MRLQDVRMSAIGGKHEPTQVLIVSADPTGLVLAICLPSLSVEVGWNTELTKFEQLERIGQMAHGLYGFSIYSRT